MLTYAMKRLGVAVLVAVTVSLVTFSLLHLSGDPAMALAGESATQEDIENIRRVYGYDRPLVVQYIDWLGGALTGDLGRSHYLKSDVAVVIFDRLPTTMTLGACALVFALLLSIPLGVAAAMRPNTMIDRFALSLAVVGQALPSFWFALILIFWLGVAWRLLPITGTDSWLNFIMPSIALGYYITPGVMRLTRAGMLEVLSQDYVRTARAKGVPRRGVLMKHAFRNAAIPLVTVTGVQFGALLGGAVVTETVFSWPGLGRLAVESIQVGDFPVVQGVVLILSAFTILANLAADIGSAWIDPRIRFE